MTKRELIFSVVNVIKGDRIKDYDNINEKLLSDIINNYRTLFMQRDFIQTSNQSNLSIDLNSFSQTLNNIELEIANLNDNGFTFQNCLKSIKPIPKLVKFRDFNGVINLSSTTFTSSIPVYNNNRLYVANSSFVTGKSRKAFIINDYIYILNDPLSEKVSNFSQKPLDSLSFYLSLHGVFVTPEEVVQFNAGENYEEDYNYVYPVREDYFTRISQSIINNELKIIEGIKEGNRNKLFSLRQDSQQQNEQT